MFFRSMQAFRDVPDKRIAISNVEHRPDSPPSYLAYLSGCIPVNISFDMKLLATRS